VAVQHKKINAKLDVIMRSIAVPSELQQAIASKAHHLRSVLH
jgi:hypothetical protein